MDDLRSQIMAYRPTNEREQSDKALILYCMDTFSNTLTRDNPVCHFTASSWVVNSDCSKVLMLHHNIQQMWMWPGGHADGESDLLQVALRETSEETGLREVQPLREGLFSLEVLTVPAHIRKGKFVSSHLHLDCSFLLEANEAERFRAKLDESSGTRWMTFAEVEKGVKHGKMSPHYLQLIEKTKDFRPERHP